MLKQNISQMKRQIKRQDIYSYIENSKFQFCITSPLTRLEQSQQKLLNDKSLDNDQREGIVITTHQACFHRNINQEALSQLIGQSNQKNKKKVTFNDSHCENIK